jgi:hypothetical protein
MTGHLPAFLLLIVSMFASLKNPLVQDRIAGTPLKSTPASQADESQAGFRVTRLCRHPSAPDRTAKG